MAGVYTVVAKFHDDEAIRLKLASRKTAIDVRNQLNEQGYEAKAQLVKDLD